MALLTHFISIQIASTKLLESIDAMTFQNQNEIDRSRREAIRLRWFFSFFFLLSFIPFCFFSAILSDVQRTFEVWRTPTRAIRTLETRHGELRIVSAAYYVLTRRCPEGNTIVANE